MFNREYLIRYLVQIRAHDIRTWDQRVKYHARAGARQRKMRSGEAVLLTKRHSFRPISTRKYYPGKHVLEIQVNGERYGKLEFELA